MKLYRVAAGAAVVLSIVGAGQALASSSQSFFSYNLTVPKFGGSATSNNIQKLATSEPARVCSSAIGGGYTLSVRVEDSNNNAQSGYYTIASTTKVDLPYYNPGQNAYYHIRLANSIFTVVNVQAQGKWSPDTNFNSACGF